MKILILTDSLGPEGGSPGMIAQSMAFGFKEKGHQVSILTTVLDPSLVGKETRDGVEVHKIFSNYHKRWQAYRSLKNSQTILEVQKFLEEFKPDVVHAHNVHFHLSYHSLELSKQSGAKVFLTAHDVMLFNYGKLRHFIDTSGQYVGPLPSLKVSALRQAFDYKWRYNPFRNSIIRHYLRYVDGIIAVSHALKKALNDNGIQNVSVIHNGIKAQNWQVDNSVVEEVKKEYQLSDQTILFAGRLSSAKGGEKIIRALSEIIKNCPEAKLLVMGQSEGVYEHKMLALAKELNIKDSIIFTGWLSGDKLKAAFLASRVVAVPSICFDSFPTVALEAMAAHKPVIGSYFGGLPEMVVDGETGFVINPFNNKVLVDKFSELLSNSEKSKKMGEAGFGRVTQLFGFDQFLQGYLDFFQKYNTK